MKLDNLLGPYLYQYKKLNLPGIGTFEADISTIVPEDNDKHHAPVQGITFKQSSEPEPDNELIEYIKTRTGKMKPLAMADLESYLMLIKQFLNIGKPFYIEGIGTLQKVTNGTLKFIPGEYISPRLENNANGSSAGSTPRTAPEKRNAAHTSKGTARKAIVALGVIATIAVIGWGGYYFYEMNANKDEREKVLPADTLVTPMPDTSAAATII
ncbi:MAG TPA: hypothetical protein VJ647_05310, partial [Chitinophagaceae bacterium]|nr:hypothetical protein [Chitinophagaceae bacterium]